MTKQSRNKEPVPEIATGAELILSTVEGLTPEEQTRTAPKCPGEGYGRRTRAQFFALRTRRGRVKDPS